MKKKIDQTPRRTVDRADVTTHTDGPDVCLDIHLPSGGVEVEARLSVIEAERLGTQLIRLSAAVTFGYQGFDPNGEAARP